LGGNRKHQIFNLLVTWFLTGFWHGASWNFILWGLWFGVLIIIEKLFLLKWLKKLPVISNVYCLFIAVMGWVMFYFEDMGQMLDCFAVMFGAAGTGFWDVSLELTITNNIFWIIAAVAFCMPILPAAKKFVENRPKLQMPTKIAMIPANAVMLIVNTALLVGMSYNPFLYYKF
ncbi:MAG: MBOAT family protein, partial [Oscillospiraceae bacterium]|nr:MBOAT family protein [Oscillospiraceae bacterium]